MTQHYHTSNRIALGAYELGPNDTPENGIYTGDALRMLTELPANSIDGLVTDPPYSSGGQFRSDRTASTRSKYAQTNTLKKYPLFEGDSRDQRSYLLWCTLWLSECWRIVKPGGVVMVFTDWRQYPVMSDALQVGGFVWRGTFVWNKTKAARPTMGRFRSQAEFVLWGSKEGMNKAVTEYLPGVFTKAVNPKEKYHQTGKPVELMIALLKILAPGMAIIDPFAGSGSTLVAAKVSGLRYIGFEINEGYANLARDRVRMTQPPLPGLTLETQAAFDHKTPSGAIGERNNQTSPDTQQNRPGSAWQPLAGHSKPYTFHYSNYRKYERRKKW